jgi:hypothetical protein
MDEKIKTAGDLVREANDLARLFYESMGYEVKEGYRFDLAPHVQEHGMWIMAAMAYEHILGIDLEDVLIQAEEEEAINAAPTEEKEEK